MQGVVVVDGGAGNGKDSNPATTTRPQPSPSGRAIPPKLLRSFLVVAVLATGFVAAVVLLLGAGVTSPGTLIPRLDALSAAATSACKEDEQRQAAGLDRWRRAPASAWHNMSDDELMWAASWRPSVPRYPYRRAPKVAFMFLTRGPLPLAPLWERFFAGGDRAHFSVYVHSTPGYRPDFPPESVFYRRQVPSQVLLVPSCFQQGKIVSTAHDRTMTGRARCV